MSSDLAHVLGIALGYLIGQALRYASRWRFWRTVKSDAERILADPETPIADPEEAAAAALSTAQRAQVRRVARTISIPPPNKEHTP